MASHEAHHGEYATTNKASRSRYLFPQLGIDRPSANAQGSRDFFVMLLVLEKMIFYDASSLLVLLEIRILRAG